GAEPDAEAGFVVRRLKLRGMADAGNSHSTNGNRVIDGIGEDRVLSGRREHAHRQHGARRVLRAREREEVGNVGRRLADRPWAVNMIGHGEPLVSFPGSVVTSSLPSTSMHSCSARKST